MAEGPMSTPRRPAPRSSAAPITAIFWRGGCMGVAAKANFPSVSEADAGSGRIRVLLADDDFPFVEALRPLIERQPELAVVGSAADGLAAIELAEELWPGAIVIDLHMALLDGVGAVARLRRGHPNMCGLALSGDAGPRTHPAVGDR